MGYGFQARISGSKSVSLDLLPLLFLAQTAGIPNRVGPGWACDRKKDISPSRSNRYTSRTTRRRLLALLLVRTLLLMSCVLIFPVLVHELSWVSIHFRLVLGRFLISDRQGTFLMSCLCLGVLFSETPYCPPLRHSNAQCEHAQSPNILIRFIPITRDSPTPYTPHDTKSRSTIWYVPQTKTYC